MLILLSSHCLNGQKAYLGVDVADSVGDTDSSLATATSYSGEGF